MKRRTTTVLNFFALNLLFFALYLNFIHKDSNSLSVAPLHFNSQNFKVGVLAEQPEQRINKESKEVAEERTSSLPEKTAVLRLSFN
jgi:hypothetical protein